MLLVLDHLREATVLWREVFGAVMRQNTADWFLMSAMLGHPTPQQCKREITNLSTLLEATVLNDPFAVEQSLETIRVGQLSLRLARFLEFTRPGNEASPKVEANWLYLMSADEEWGVVNLGVIKGCLEQAVVEMDELNPELAPYGIAGAWRVKYLETGYDIAARVLKKAYIEPDFYEFQSLEDVDAMKTAIARNLSD